VDDTTVVETPVREPSVPVTSLTRVGTSWFTVPTPLPSGPVRVAVTRDGVVATSFGPGPDVPDLVLTGDEAKAATVRERMAEYFAGHRRSLDLPIDWSATAGPQRTVLQWLQRSVGFGETVAYGELAARSGAFEGLDDPGVRMQAARAVGSIMGSNPVPLLVPCHRVVAADGLGGFGGGAPGLEIKRWLLTLEGVLAPTLDWNGPG
jgi:methylated-DNA-[protein]-cysteine S-methyltransferase